MKIAITGSNGFIGQHLKKRLEKEGHIIYAIDKFMINSTLMLLNFFNKKKPDIIYHLACYGNHYHQTNDEFCVANIKVLYHLLDRSFNAKIKSFYNFSTSSVNLKDITFYSATKKAGELICEAFKQKYKMNIINIRPYSVYGPGEADWRFIPVVIRSLLTNAEMQVDENATHDWIYIDDFIDALLDGKTEIGTGRKTRNIEIVAALENISGKTLNYNPVNNLRSYDNDSWVCPVGVKHISIEEGLRKTFEYYEKRGFEKKDH
jgi:nucleoside-diphosphate-sugar epimerase